MVTSMKSFGATKRIFIFKNCKLPSNHQKAKFWNETLKKLQLSFLDDKLIRLSLELQTHDGYKTLYNKHGKHILALLGKPIVADLAYVKWAKKNDEAIVEDKGNGLVSILIHNKKVMANLKP